jgi:hypothetical protein
VPHDTGASTELDSRETRELAGVELLKLLRADYFASFIWNPDERRFAGHVFINMDPLNLERYSSYYQFHNPLTGPRAALGPIKRCSPPAGPERLVARNCCIGSGQESDLADRGDLS